jgi:hypothetical protein
MAQFVVSFVKESEISIHRWDTPNSAHPCAGSGGDVLSPHGPIDEYLSHSPSALPNAILPKLIHYRELELAENIN